MISLLQGSSMTMKRKREEIMSIFYFAMVEFRNQNSEKGNKCFHELVKFFDEDSGDEDDEKEVGSL